MVREKVFVHNNAQIMERKMWQFILLGIRKTVFGK